MRIKSFKLFESFKSSNSNYETLKDVLQSELFDELDIETIPNPVHSFDEFGRGPKSNERAHNLPLMNILVSIDHSV
jgi:hypothetical protein